MALWPFQLPFMLQAMAIGVLVAVPTALLSCFLVLKGWSLMGDAISHAVLPGVVIAYIVGLPLGVGAFAAGMLCALSVGFLKENSRIKEDTVMGVVFAGLFGLGIVLYTAIRTDVHLDHILFGNMLGVGQGDLITAGIIALVVTALVVAKWRDLMLFIFDPQQAGAIGLPVRLLHYGLLALISLTIVGALQAVGIVLVIALLIAPGAIAFLVTRQFGQMLVIATAISVGCSLVGIYLSFFLDSAPAPTIVLLMSASFVVALIATQRKTVAAV
ncbi:MAG: metal ABC transporter permease [Devosia sp.]|nr:MAG: metal ABC transporter permease [Devosia sp.]